MNPPAGPSDETLVEGAQDGDRLAFEELVRRHAERLYAVVRRFGADDDDAQEITQEAFLRAWRGIGRFRGQSQFFTWLCRIGLNEAKRRATRRPPEAAVTSGGEALADEIPDWSESPETRFEQSALRAALESAIRGLPTRFRAAVILRDVEGLSTRDAAAVMGLTEPAFKSRLHRGRLVVRRSLEAEFPEEER